MVISCMKGLEIPQSSGQCKSAPCRMNGASTICKRDVMTEHAEASKPFSFKEFGDAFVEFFSSLKLAILLMITLAILSTVGTVIQQGEQADVYIKEYGEN